MGHPTVLRRGYENHDQIARNLSDDLIGVTGINFVDRDLAADVCGTCRLVNLVGCLIHKYDEFLAHQHQSQAVTHAYVSIEGIS